MKKLLALMIAGWALAAASPAPAPTVDGLAWLGGAWLSRTGQDWTEELWMAPRGGVMLGTNRSGKGPKVTGFEYMRIATEADGKVNFWGSPGGKAPVAFRLISAGPRQAIFENPAHDFPTRIVYRREGEALVATVSGPGGKNPLSWTFRRPPAR